jgi:hypothetical protein
MVTISVLVYPKNSTAPRPMKAIKVLLITGISVMILCSTAFSAGPSKKPANSRVAQAKRLTTAQKKLLATREMLIEKKQLSRDRLESMIETYEEKLASEASDNEITKIMYAWDLTSKAKLDESERDLADTRSEIEQFRRWIAEDDHALALAGAKDQQSSNRLVSVGSFHGRTMLISYAGSADWSLVDAGKIAKFYLARFGHALPISAMGQSTTHERMGLDHSDAMDVAVRPDTTEGQTLMAYLRKAGIPFIAFRSKLRGWATGAHIHIGRPSPKFEQASQSAHLHAVEKRPDQG